MTVFLKIFLLGIYGSALAGSLGILPASQGLWYTQIVAASLLAGHALEAVLMLKTVRRYSGPLWVSVLQTVLFGIIHLRPLQKQQTKA